MKKLVIATLLILATGYVNAQHLHCGTSEKMLELLRIDPELEASRERIEAFTKEWITANGTVGSRAVITIPVVVHVVYNSSSENISDAQIQSQIEVLNEDYRKLNADVSGVPGVWNDRIADCEIEFQLATCDPNGFSTNGITRTQTDVTSWNGSDDVKRTSEGGHNAWPAADYMNIWVCNIGGGLLGYAYQPGVSAWLDGVVIGYQYFGKPSQSNNYNLGRTATHEIGHYFNLDHLWGAGGNNQNCTADDGVSDTPKQQGPNFDCDISYPNETCGSGVNSDMFNNYMDYGNDECLFFFTNGQKNRMLAALNGPRASLLSSNGLDQCPVGIEEHILEASLNVFPNPTSDVISIQSDAKDGVMVDVRIMDMSGKEMNRFTDIRLGHSAIRFNVEHLSSGTYILEILSENEVVSKKINIRH